MSTYKRGKMRLYARLIRLFPCPAPLLLLLPLSLADSSDMVKISVWMDLRGEYCHSLFEVLFAAESLFLDDCRGLSDLALLKSSFSAAAVWSFFGSVYLNDRFILLTATSSRKTKDK